MIGELFDPRKTFGAAVTKVAAENKDVVVFSADSGKSSGFAGFIEQFPERYFEVGIAEQVAVGMAAGMATAGKIPVFCAITPFVTARPYEMVRNDLGYMRQNVKIVGRNTGMTYSDLGVTHQGLDDMALMSLIPGMTVLAPQDPTEIEEAVAAMIAHEGPVYMRIGNPKIPQIFEREPFVIGKGKIISEGKEDQVTLISTGSCTTDAMQAAEILRGQGIGVCHIGMPTVLPLDETLVRQAAEKTGRVVTVEEAYVHGGLGSIVTEAVSDMAHVTVKRLGMPMDYAITSANYRELLAYYHLDEKGIAQSVADFVRG
ncbi:MAG: transketolase [Lachnospiraceae bacterium]|nr:transketolase [Lachnospiraceae bacterium]